MKRVILICLGLGLGIVHAQNQKIVKPKTYLNADKSAYADLGFTGQIWSRYTQLNQGTLVNGLPKDAIFDVGLRRWRLTSDIVLSSRSRAFIQFGQNNFNYKSAKYTGAFFHDAQIEFDLFSQSKTDQSLNTNDKIAHNVREVKATLGTGLFGWSGPSRYASPSVASLLSLDAPLYQQATNGVSDQFLRKLGVYFKGEFGRLEYRTALTTPMTLSGVEANPNINYSVYNPTNSSLQPQAYFKFQLKDKESVNTAYSKSTYLGDKEVLTLGTGFVQQNNAFWSKSASGDTIMENMFQLAFDVFYESKMDSSGRSITAYVSYHNYQFGHDNYRNIGVMNLATGANSATGLGGSGNGFPALGTGDCLYGQLAFLKKRDKDGRMVQAYVTSQLVNYKVFSRWMAIYDVGLNYMPKGNQNIKYSLDYQSRPEIQGTLVDNKTVGRKGMIVFQSQLAF